MENLSCSVSQLDDQNNDERLVNLEGNTILIYENILIINRTCNISSLTSIVYKFFSVVRKIDSR